jgi:hypothetical protein
MRERVDYKKIRGVTVWEACDYCKEKRRIPGGKYKDQGEVIDCPVCDGRGVTRIIISIAQFHKLLTMTDPRVKKPSYGRTRSQHQVRKVRSPARRS